MRKAIALVCSLALAAGAPVSSWAAGASGRHAPAAVPVALGLPGAAPPAAGVPPAAGLGLPSPLPWATAPAPQTAAPSLEEALTASAAVPPTPQAALQPAPVAAAQAAPEPAAAVGDLLAPAQALLEAVPAAAAARLPAAAAHEAGDALQDALEGAARKANAASVELSAAEPAPGQPAAGPALEPAQPAAGASPASQPPSPAAAAPAPLRPWAHRASRLAAALLVRLLYRLRVHGAERVPKTGPALVLSNHVSYADAALIALAAGRPVRFLMHRAIYDRPALRWLFRLLGAIPVAAREGKDAVEAALAAARGALASGELVVIFPEGMLTRTGNLAPLKHGFERIAAGVGAPVIPAHLDGLWGAPFSLKPGESRWARLARVPAPVILRFGEPLPAVSVQSAREAIEQLGAASMEERVARQGKTAVRAFFATARSRWGRLATADSTGKALRFGEALAASVLLAGLLGAQLPAGRNVGVLLPSSAGGLLANVALGVLGRVPVNLNYTAPPEAQDYAVRKAAAAAVVTSRAFLGKLEEKLGRRVELPASLVFLEDLLPLVPKWKRLATYLALRLLPRAVAEAVFLRRADRSLHDTAAILFTSGSSGMPKGVELTHMNLRADIEMVREVYGLGRDDRLLGALPFFHSFGLAATLWLPLLAGFAAVYHTHPLEAGPIAALGEKYGPTLLLGTPTFLAAYVKDVPAPAFAGLRLVLAGAERLRPETAEAFRAKFGVRPLEGYGATELSPIAAVNVPDAPGQRGSLAGSVGQPLPGEAARVVDPETGAPVADGRPGMLLVRGPNVMKGYLGEPEKTAEVLEDGWYRTGDIAVIDRGGFITLVGRLSRFSKLAGEMVSHVAVEDKLHQAAGVADQAFVVMGVPDARRGERLVVLVAGWKGDLDDLLARARAAGLPRLWTPAKESFFEVERIPVLGTGKLDLKAAQDLARRLAGP